MILYLTHFRWIEGDQKTYGVLSDVPISQIQNAGLLAQGTNLEDDASALPYVWNFLTGQVLSQAVSSLDVSRMTVVSELELDVGNISAFYQYKATTTDSTINDLLLSNPDGDLSNPDDYVIYNGMYHGKVQDLPAGMFEGATLVRFKDLEDIPEDDPSGASLDMITLTASNEESTGSSAASLKVKDKNGNWVDISDVSVRTHGGSAQSSNPLLQTIPCYPNPYGNNSTVTRPSGEEVSGETWPEGYYDCIIFLDSSFNPIPFDKDNLDDIHYIIRTGNIGGYQTIYYKSSGTYNSPTGLPQNICPCDPQWNVIRFNRLDYNEEAESDTLRAYQMVDRYEYNESTQQNEYVSTEEDDGNNISITFNVSQPMQLPIAQLLLSGYYGG